MPANTSNITAVQTSNTFGEWRVQTNLASNDVNKIIRGDFTKPEGNVIVTAGYVQIANSIGTTLQVDANARVSGMLSVKNFEQDGSPAYFYSDSNDVQFKSPSNIVQIAGNTKTRFLYNNNFSSLANVNANGYIETTGTFSNTASGLVMNIANYLTVANGTGGSRGNVNVTTNLTVTSNTTSGNLVVRALANIVTGNIVTANIATLNVNAPGATANILTLNVASSGAVANMANVTIANSVTTNASIDVANITTRMNAVLANIVTANIATLNVNATGSSANILTLNVNSTGAVANIANATIANSTTTNATISVASVTTRINAVLANIVTANIATLNVNATGAIANIANVTIANSVTTNASIDVLSVGTRANILAANIPTLNSAAATIPTLNVTNETVTGTLNVATLNTSSLNVSTATVGTLNTTNQTVSGTLNVGTSNVTTLNVGSETVTTLNVTNQTVSGTLNASTGNIATLSVTSLTVANPISAPSESDSDSYRLRVSQTSRAPGYFGVRLGSTANGNAWITFDTVNGNVWRQTANSTEGTYYTILSVQNVSDSISTTSSSNVASLTAVKTAYDQATSAYGAANSAANTASVYHANTNAVTDKQKLEVANSASINVTVSTSGSNTRLSFSANTSNPAALGPQGYQGLQGYQGFQGVQGQTGLQGFQGIQGTAGSTGVQGAQGIQGFNGTQGGTGPQGYQGIQGATGSGTQGATGLQGVQGAIGTGTQGAQGVQGSRGQSLWSYTLSGTVTASATAGTFGKYTGAAGTYDSQVYSNEGYIRGVYATFRPTYNDRAFFMGLNSDPSSSAASGDIDYAFYFRTDNVCDMYESGSAVGSSFAYSANDQFTITYDGVNVRYYQNSTLKRTVARSIGNPLYLDSSFATVGAESNSVAFGPMGEVGAQGVQGTQGPIGLQGNQGLQGYQGVVGAQGQLGVQGQTGVQGAGGPSTTLNSTNITTGNYFLVGVAAAGSNQTPSSNGDVYINGSKLYAKSMQISTGTSGVTTGLYLSSGDITVARSSTEGVVYLGSSGTAYLYFNGSNYTMPAAPLYIPTTGVYAPAFIDYDNNNYYINPAGYSVVSTIKADRVIGGLVSGTSVSGPLNIDLSTSNFFKYTLSGSTSFTFINPPSNSSNTYQFSVMVVQPSGGGAGVTWSSSPKWPGASAPPATTTANAVDVWTFFTTDGGTTYHGTLSFKDSR